MWVGGVWMAARGPDPAPAAAPEPGRKPAQPASDGSGPKPTSPTMPCSSGSKRPAPCETYHHNNRRRPTDHPQITRNDHRSYQNLAEGSALTTSPLEALRADRAPTGRRNRLHATFGTFATVALHKNLDDQVSHHIASPWDWQRSAGLRLPRALRQVRSADLTPPRGAP